MNSKLSRRTFVAAGVGAILFFVCGRFIAIPTPDPETSITVQYGVQAFVAAVFGPVAGTLAGLIGHALVDASRGGGIWWSWVISSALFGCLMGRGTRRLALADGVCTRKELLHFNMTQLACHLLCWAVCAPVLDIVIYDEPIEKLFIQGLISGVANAVTTALVGSLLCVAYARFRARKGNPGGKN